MPVRNLNYGPGFPRVGHSPALDALLQLVSLNPTGSGSTGSINPNRLTEQDNWSYPPPATPPGEVSGPDHILNSLRMVGIRKGPMQNMAPERREKPSQPAIEG